MFYFFINCCIDCEAHNKLHVSFCFESICFICYQERIETRQWVMLMHAL